MSESTEEDNYIVQGRHRQLALAREWAAGHAGRANAAGTGKGIQPSEEVSCMAAGRAE